MQEDGEKHLFAYCGRGPGLRGGGGRRCLKTFWKDEEISTAASCPSREHGYFAFDQSLVSDFTQNVDGL